MPVRGGPIAISLPRSAMTCLSPVQSQAQHDLPIGVGVPSREETESSIEAGRSVLSGHTAGQQLTGPLLAHECDDLTATA
jgi:hypothetical protein